jgi:hypothetical protein
MTAFEEFFMTDRICIVDGCGRELGALQRRGAKCRECQAQERQALKDMRHQQRGAVAKLKGASILLHSCLSNGVLDPPIDCLCRKYITVDQARHLVNIVGRAVDFETRKEFFNNAPIIEKDRLKSPPLSTLGQRIAIERKTEHRDLDEKDITRLRATIDEDKLWRAKEHDCKIDIENDLAIASRAEITKEYSEKEWLAIEKVQKTLPAYVSGVGFDERTPTGRKRKFRTLKRTKDTQVTGIRSESAVAAEQSVELVSLESLSEAA